MFLGGCRSASEAHLAFLNAAASLRALDPAANVPVLSVLPTVGESRGLAGLFEAQRNLDLLHEHARRLGAASPQAAAEGSLERGGRICFIENDFAPSQPEEAVLEGLRKNPDDAGLRHVYADMLLERGDERGELINLNLRPLTWERITRAGEIERRLIGDLERKLGVKIGIGFYFKGGFLSGISIEEPTKQAVEGLFESLDGPFIRDLEIRNADGAEWILALAQSPHASNLKRLSLVNTGLGVEGILALARCRLASLTNLHLSSNGIGEEGARALARFPYLSKLTTLELWNENIGAEGARALAGSPYLSVVTTLRLMGNHIRDEGLRALAQSPLHSKLAILELWNENIGVDGVRALVQSSLFAKLRTLNLTGNVFGPDGARALARPPHPSNLVTLGLPHCGIGDEGAEALADSRHLSKVESLYLSSNEIGDAGARALAQPSAYLNLRVLDLMFNRIGAEGAQALRESPFLSRIWVKT